MEKFKPKQDLISLIKWWITAFVGFLIGNYLVVQLKIINNFSIVLIISAIISILVQIISSHYNEFNFKLRWFMFYFLTYAMIIMILEEHFFSKTGIIMSALITGFIISIIIILIRKMELKSHTIPWISIILILILAVANLGYLENLLGMNLQVGSQDSRTTPENERTCPNPHIVEILAIDSNLISDSKYLSQMENLVDSSVWRLEHNFDSCYIGKYKGQYPNWIYCDNMIVSRWEIGNSGAISYRWYTAVSGIWEPQNLGASTYKFIGFACENGQKVTVTKGVTNYYVYDSRDGSKIKIAY